MYRFSVAVKSALLASALALSASQAMAADWSGFYLGGSIGGTDGRADVTTTVKSPGDYFSGTDFQQIRDLGKNELTETNLSGGLQAGYDTQVNNWLFGLVVSVNSLSFDASQSRQADILSVLGSFYVDQRIQSDWMATVRPKLGWAQDNWLVYGTAGLALTEMKMDFSYRDTAAFSGESRTKMSQILPGWTAGFGGEYALDNNWSLSGEYLFTTFKTMDVATRVSDTFAGADAYLDNDASLQVHALMLGVVYRFK